jgi:WD40 repeat protein
MPPKKSSEFGFFVLEADFTADLAKWLDGQNMEHVRGAPYHPMTQVKIERWHQTTGAVALPGERAISASIDNTLRLWDLASGETLRVLEGHSASVTHIAALSGERALSASIDNTLRLWDLENGNCESKIVADDPITTFALTAEEGRGIAGLANGKIFLFELSSVASNIA